MCMSCPHACITPTCWPLYSVFTVDLNGTSTSSVTGKASMSDRRATTGPGLPPRSTADDAGLRDACPHLQPQRAQVLGDLLGRAHLAIAQLGVLVEVAPPRDQLRLERRRARVDAVVQAIDRAGCAIAGAEAARQCTTPHTDGTKSRQGLVATSWTTLRGGQAAGFLERTESSPRHAPQRSLPSHVLGRPRTSGPLAGASRSRQRTTNVSRSSAPHRPRARHQRNERPSTTGNCAFAVPRRPCPRRRDGQAQGTRPISGACRVGAALAAAVGSALRGSGGRRPVDSAGRDARRRTRGLASRAARGSRRRTSDHGLLVPVIVLVEVVRDQAARWSSRETRELSAASMASLAPKCGRWRAASSMPGTDR